MKKIIIGGLVGGIILFIWQFLSWSILNIHGSNMQYTPQQESILEALEASGIKEGSYFLPNVAPDVPGDQRQAEMQKNVGKPWALVSYRESMDASMGSNMFRGFIMNVVLMSLLAWLLLQFKDLTLGRAVLASLAVGFIGYMIFPYLNSIWFENNSMPDLVDAIVQFGLGGAWLGFWLGR